VFTVGGSLDLDNLAGFRVYTTFKGTSPLRQQLTSVFNNLTGEFKGIIFGNLLGAYRTGAIGGLAVKYMANKNAESIGINDSIPRYK